MRYELNAERYSTEAQLSSDLLNDPVILAGQRKAEISGEIDKLRADRWGFCALTLDGNDPKIVITNRIAFEISCESEQKVTQELRDLINMFNKLNPLFEEFQAKYTMVKSPTLTGIQQMRNSSAHKISTLVARTKSELAVKMGIQSKGQDVNDVLKDPAFINMKETNEGYIKIEEEKIKEFDFYIARIMAILEGKDGE